MRQKISLDENWLFHRGDIIRKRPTSKGPIYTGAKTVRERWGAASYDYNDDPDDYRQGVEYNSDRWEELIFRMISSSRENLTSRRTTLSAFSSTTTRGTAAISA